jgi:plastocyanin
VTPAHAGSGRSVATANQGVCVRTFLLVQAVAALLAAPALRAQSLLYRSPNLSGDWVPDAGVVQFNLVHRFNVSPAPARVVTNFPTFTLAAGLGRALGLGYRFATKSQIAGGSSTNESEVFARWRFRGGPEGSEGLSASVTPAYNFRAGSVDGELAADYTRGPLTVLGGVRELGKAFGGSRAQTALAGGAVVRINRYVALAGDYARPLGGDTTAAWSFGIHVLIPGSPHSFALEVSNVASNTYQGSSRGLDVPAFRRLVGFEFTIPLHLSRFGGWFHPGRSEGADLGATGPAAAVVPVAAMRFASDTTRIAAGQIVRWVNRDPVEHTVSFDGEGPPSGSIPVHGSYAVRFDRPGTYPYLCTLHPFMRGVVVVR